MLRGDARQLPLPDASVDLAYIAGIIDGEGCIQVGKTKPYKCMERTTPSYVAKVQVRMADREAIDFILDWTGKLVTRAAVTQLSDEFVEACDALYRRSKELNSGKREEVRT
jgi:hypothetical protein